MFHKVIVLLKYVDLFLRHANLTGEDFHSYCNSQSYYAGIMPDFFRYLLC